MVADTAFLARLGQRPDDAYAPVAGERTRLGVLLAALEERGGAHGERTLRDGPLELVVLDAKVVAPGVLSLYVTLPDFETFIDVHVEGAGWVEGEPARFWSRLAGASAELLAYEAERLYGQLDRFRPERSDTHDERLRGALAITTGFLRVALLALVCQARDPQQQVLRVEAVAELGVVAALRLRAAEIPELTAVTAELAADVADRTGAHRAARIAWQLAAIAVEARGDTGLALEWFRRSLRTDRPPPDPELEADLRLAAATSAVASFDTAEVDALDLEERALAARLAQAESDLVVAETLHRAAGEPSEEQFACALVRGRILALRGDSAAALAQLDRVVADPAWERVATVTNRRVERFHRLLTYYRLAADDFERVLGYALEHEPSRERLDDPAYFSESADDPSPLLHGHACILEIVLGDLLSHIAQAPPEGTPVQWLLAAANAYSKATIIQANVRAWALAERRSRASVRSWLDADALGRYAATLDAIRGRGEALEESMISDLFRSIDGQIGHSFTRDVGLHVGGEPLTARDRARMALRLRRARGYKQALGSRALVEYLSAMATDTAPGAHGGAAISPRPDDELWIAPQVSPRSAFVHFVTARAASYAVILGVRHERLYTELVRLRVDDPGLRRAAQHMQAYFSPAGPYAGIDPADPSRHDEKFLQPLRFVAQQLEPLAAALEGHDLVVLFPHATAWSRLPVHAMLLRPLWRTGERPAIVYGANIRAVARMVVRHEGLEGPRPRIGALLTTPHAAREAASFGAARARLASALALERVSAYEPRRGRESVVAAYRAAAGAADLLHLLGHGSYAGDEHPLRSGLVDPADAARPLLTGEDVLVADLHAGHVTIQACSIGMARQGTEGEMWGLSRALTVAGASSVLAPVWPLDLDSSTELLTRFYTRWLYEGRSKRESWAQAQFDLATGASTEEHMHMYHWAAMQFVGVS